LANKLAGEYFIRENEFWWAKHYLTASFEDYREWGAFALVKELLKTHGAHVDQDRPIRQSSGNPALRRQQLFLEDGPIVARTVDFDSLSTRISTPLIC